MGKSYTNEHLHITTGSSPLCTSWMLLCLSITEVALLKIAMKLMEQSIFMEMDIETITVDDVVCYEAPLLHCTTHLDQSHHNIEVYMQQPWCRGAISL